MISGVLTIEELPPNGWKDTIDGEAAQIGLESKYQADCMRAFPWKRLMLIDPVSFLLSYMFVLAQYMCWYVCQ